jgi:DNA-3-methyladenine glycosylase
MFIDSRRMIAKRPPDPRLRVEPDELGLRPAPRAFYLRDTVVVARDLIGAVFARRWRGRWYGGRIVETEAYLGANDAAAHSFGGRRTKRVEPMYAAGGHLYVYFVYGMHTCANVVTAAAEVAEAVLLRAAEGPGDAPPKLLSGPGKLCAAMGITVADSGLDLVEARDVTVFRPRGRRRVRIGESPRIGVDYAGDARAWPLRFFDVDSSAVSRRSSVR